MRTIIILPLLAAVTLAGCKNEPAGPKSEDQVKAEVAQMVKPRPGLYSSSVKMINFEVPGMPPAQAERLKGMFSQTAQARQFCLTPEESEKGYREMTKKLAQGNCTYDRFEAQGGTLDAKLTCQTAKGMSAVIEMQGTMTPEGSQMHMKMDQSMAAMPGKGVKMEMEVSSTRVGDCK